MSRRSKRPAFLLVAIFGGLALALAPATALAQGGPPEGEPACTEPAEPNQGPPSNPPEDTPLSAEPADPDDCPDETAGAAGSADGGDAAASSASNGTAGDESDASADGDASGGAEVAGVVETADGEAPDELARTGTPAEMATVIGILALLLGSSTLAIRRRWV